MQKKIRDPKWSVVKVQLVWGRIVSSRRTAELIVVMVFDWAPVKTRPIVMASIIRNQTVNVMVLFIIVKLMLLLVVA